MIASHLSHLPYQFIDTSFGGKIAYIDKGQGPYTLIFLHGLATYSGTWIHNIESLQHHFRCVAIDFPGNGYSEPGEYPYSMAFYADATAAIIQQLKLQNVILCGHSMGGQVAMTFALKYPDSINKMILCAPAGFEHFNFFEKNLYRSMLGWTEVFGENEEHLRNMIYQSFAHNPFQADPMLAELGQLLQKYPPRSYKKMLDLSIQGMLDEPVLHKIGAIKMPVLVLFGDADTLIPNRLIHPFATTQMAKDAVSRMQEAHLKIINHAGHFVQWEKAAEVNSEIRMFLKN